MIWRFTGIALLLSIFAAADSAAQVTFEITLHTPNGNLEYEVELPNVPPNDGSIVDGEVYTPAGDTLPCTGQWHNGGTAIDFCEVDPENREVTYCYTFHLYKDEDGKKKGNWSCQTWYRGQHIATTSGTLDWTYYRGLPSRCAA